MGAVISIGNQSFGSIREMGSFYIDKTEFIKEWWESQDIVTLLTRPCRFGKILNLSMVECFFSNQYEGRAGLFAGLSIWDSEKYRNIQGTYPVLFISFAGIKADNYEIARDSIIQVIINLYVKYSFLLHGNSLSKLEKEYFDFIKPGMPDAVIAVSLHNLSLCINRYYGRKVIILLDEYDTLLQEAYVYGYWDKLVTLIRSLLNYTFKTNPYLEHGLMTGITRTSKESIFLDLNNMAVITITSRQYATCFGFTEEEVFQALCQQIMIYTGFLLLTMKF